MTWVELGVVVVAAASLGCRSEPANGRSHKAVAAKDFWPDAPVPTVKNQARAFRYAPQQLGAYTMHAEGGLVTKSQLQRDYEVSLDFELRTGTLPGEHDVFIDTLHMTIYKGRLPLELRVDRNELVVVRNGKTARVGRDDPDALEEAFLDIAGMTDKAVTTLRIDSSNKVHTDTHEAHPLVSLGAAGDVLATALLLFPDLPASPVKPGGRWRMMRATPLGSLHRDIEVTFELEYVGDGACPSGAQNCSLVAFTATTPVVKATTAERRELRGTYAFAGKVYFDRDRGAIDESRVRGDIDATEDGVTMPFYTTYIIKPVR